MEVQAVSEARDKDKCCSCAQCKSDPEYIFSTSFLYLKVTSTMTSVVIC